MREEDESNIKHGWADTEDDKKRPTKLLCSICKKPQFETPSGLVCEEGHGGADSIEPEEKAMGRVKELLLGDRAFTEQESMYSLADKMLREIEADLALPNKNEQFERDLIRLREALIEIRRYY